MTPASPQYRFCRFQLMGLAGSRSLEWSRAARIPMMRPGRAAAAGRDHRLGPAGPRAGAGGARAREPERALGPGKKGELRGHPHEAPEARGLVANAPGGPEVDPERFFGEEILSGAQHVEINGLVQMVGHGDVDDVDVGPGEERPVVGVEVPNRK